LANVGILIVDEVHTFYTEKRIRALLAVRPRYVIPMSATPEREDGRHLIVEFLAGTTYVTVPGRDFRVRQIRTGFEPTFQLDRDGTPIWTTLVDSLVGSAMRNDLIADVVAALVKEEKRKPLVLTARLEHSEVLGKLISERLGKPVSVFQGNLKTYEDSDVLIGTSQKLGTGFDEKAFVGSDVRRIDTVVITFSLQSLALLQQLIGRGFRTNETPLVVQFRDINGMTEKHARKLVKFYRSLGMEVEIVGGPTTAKVCDGLAADGEAWLKSRCSKNKSKAKHEETAPK